MTNRNKRETKLVWVSVSLSILAICLLAVRHRIEENNDAEIDRIAAEIERIDSAINGVLAQEDVQPEAVRTFVKDDAAPSLDLLTQRLSRAKWTKQSPLSGESLALCGALACILAAFCINLRFIYRHASAPNKAGEQIRL